MGSPSEHDETMSKAAERHGRRRRLASVRSALAKERVYWPRTIGLRLTLKQSVQLAVILLAMLALVAGTVQAIATGTWDPGP